MEDTGVGPHRDGSVLQVELPTTCSIAIFLDVALASLYCNYLKQGPKVPAHPHTSRATAGARRTRTVSSFEAWRVRTSIELGGRDNRCHIICHFPTLCLEKTLSSPSLRFLVQRARFLPCPTFLYGSRVTMCLKVLGITIIVIYYSHRPGYQEAQVPTVALLLAVTPWTSYLFSQPLSSHL